MLAVAMDRLASLAKAQELPTMVDVNERALTWLRKCQPKWRGSTDLFRMSMKQ